MPPAEKILFGREIDSFLKGISEEAQRKLWKVVNALRLSQEISGAWEFPLPLEKIRRNKASDEDAREALTNLHQRGIIHVSYPLKVKYSPDEYKIKTISELPDIYSYSGTKVRIDKDRFAYLQARLRGLQHPVSPFEGLIELEESFDEKNCIVASRALKLVAKEIDGIPSLKSTPEMGRFLKSCGVSDEYYEPWLKSKPFRLDVRDVYSAENILATIKNPASPPSKEDFEKHSRAMVLYRILLHYSCGPEKDQRILFHIIESAIHPLLHDGDSERTSAFRNRVNNLIEHAGFFFEGRKILRLEERVIYKPPTPRILTSEESQQRKRQVVTMKRIVARNEEREKIAEEVLKRLQKTSELPLRNDKERLRFYSETGDITLRGERGEVSQGSKGFALLTIMDGSKNTPFALDDIKNEGNPLVNKPAHFFRSEKDVDDTIRLLKSKLKVGKKAYFPIEKKGSRENKKWLWIEK